MTSLNPLDNRFVETISELQGRIYSLETARQPYLGDWINVTTTDTTLVGTTGIVTFSEYDPRTKFAIGDRIRLSQTSATPSSYKYFYVISISSSTIKIIGDTLSGDDLEYLDYSKNVQPVGFPVDFSYTPTLTLDVVSGDTLTLNSTGTVSSSYSIIGNFCFFSLDRSTVNITGTAGDNGFLHEALPVAKDTSQTQEFYSAGTGVYDTGAGLVNISESFKSELTAGDIVITMANSISIGVSVTVGAYSYNSQIFYKIDIS